MTSVPEPLAAPAILVPAKPAIRPFWSWRGVLLIAAFLAVAIGFAVPPILDQVRGGSTKDYGLWYLTSQRIAQGKDIYVRDGDGDFEFMYPPPAAALLAIPGQWGALPLMLVVIGITTASWLACILLSVYLATGGVRGAIRCCSGCRHSAASASPTTPICWGSRRWFWPPVSSGRLPACAGR